MPPKDWLPLIGVVVGAVLGWVFNQLAQWLVVRRDEKRAIGRAVADLLEIRLRLLVIPKAVEVLSKKFSIRLQDQAVLKVVLTQLFPTDDDLGKRYGEAVTLVAAANPILGFRLRSQDIVSPLLHQMRTIALSDSAGVSLFSQFEEKFIGHLKPHLEGLIRQTAWAHGVVTWVRALRILRRPLEIPDTLMESLTTLQPGQARGLGDGAK